jgi:hypothetical protein
LRSNGSVTRVNVRAVQLVSSGELVFPSQTTSEEYNFPQAGLVAVCPPGSLAQPGNGMWCYTHHPLGEPNADQTTCS